MKSFLTKNEEAFNEENENWFYEDNWWCVLWH